MRRRILTPVFIALAVALLLLPSPRAFAEFGTNWTATYYNCPDFNCPVVATQTGINGINANYGTGSPIANVNADNFTIRFESVQQFQAGTYEFVVSSDDGVRVFIDGLLVLDRFGPRTLQTDRFQQTLTAGPHSIRVDYLELLDQAQVQFQYFPTVVGTTVPTTPTIAPGLPGGPTLVPTPLPPIPPGALTATVINASVLNVRAAPFLGAPRVGRVLRGQTYAIVGRDERAEWFLLQLSGQQAWAWGYYLFVPGNSYSAPVANSFATSGQPASSAPFTVQTTSSLRLRAAPNLAAVQTGRVPWGEILPVIGRTAGGDWYQVVFRGTVGWIISGYSNALEGDLNAVPVTG